MTRKQGQCAVCSVQCTVCSGGAVTFANKDKIQRRCFKCARTINQPQFDLNLMSGKPPFVSGPPLIPENE